jgi:hypothetical protein
VGYLTQNVSYGVNNGPDVEQGFNATLTNLLIEAKYKFSDRTSLFVSGMGTVDWIYDLKHNDSSWKDKRFADSRRNLYIDDKDWQLLKEAYVTWTPENSFIRAGKQIVIWGEMDGFRIMDQINPLDQRRGMADVEFETTRIPIWLLRLGYDQGNLQSSWLQELGYEFVFNPNVQFIRNQPILPGNNEGGIWAPNIETGPNMRLGSAIRNIEKVRAFTSEGFEYAGKIRGVLWDSIISLNGYYGLDKDPVTRTDTSVRPTMSVASDGARLLHIGQEGYFPRFKFLGTTFTRDITPLKASFLGGVSPILRLEGLYAFDTTLVTKLNTFEKFDEYRWGAGVDWKVKIPFLNPNTYFVISPQFYHRKILGYPSYELNNLYKDTYQYTLMVSTSYYHNKIAPSFFWQRDMRTNSDLFRFQLVYEHNVNWRFTAGTIIINGSDKGAGLDPLENKDYIFLKASYKFN